MTSQAWYLNCRFRVMIPASLKGGKVPGTVSQSAGYEGRLLGLCGRRELSESTSATDTMPSFRK